MVRRLFACAALALVSVVGAREALANGRFPRAGQIAVDPADPAHIVVRATFGLMVTRNASVPPPRPMTHGASVRWDWVCESAVGFGDFEDPGIAVTKDGSILAETFKGVSIGRGDTCDWSFAGGGLAGAAAVDVSTERPAPSRVVVI